MEESIREKIKVNVLYLEMSIPSFEANKVKFAEWMLEFKMNSTEIMLSPLLASKAYNLFTISKGDQLK